MFATKTDFWTEDKTEDGINYKDYYTKYWQWSAEFLYTGQSTKTAASNVVFLFIEAAGTAWTPLSIFSSVVGYATSLYDLFTGTYGTVYGSSSDQAYATLVYDCICRHTQKLDGLYDNFLTTYKVWLDKVGFMLTLDGNIYAVEASLNYVKYSQRYNSPYSWLRYSTYSEADGVITASLLGTTAILIF